MSNNYFQVCESCKQQFDRRGLTSHQAPCLKKAEQQGQDAKFDAKMQDLAAQQQLREGMDIMMFKFKLLMLNTLLNCRNTAKAAYRKTLGEYRSP